MCCRQFNLHSQRTQRKILLIVMKKIFFTFCCMLLTCLSFSQKLSKEYEIFKWKGDSLYKIKQYKNSALAYSTALRVKGGEPSIDDRWSTACSWSLGNFSDSAFAQLNGITVSKDLTLYYFSDIINDKDFTPLHTDKRWQKIKDKMFENSKKNFTASIMPWGKDSTARRMETAIGWTLMNSFDSAFAIINIIANESNVATYKLILYNKGLEPLHSDKRWQTTIEKVTRNLKCAFYEGNTFVPMIFSVDETSSYIKGDGLGSYFNGVDFAITSNANLYLISRNQKDTTHLRRKLVFDLDHPVPGSGSVAQGIIQDSKAEFHALYKIDQTVIPAIVYDIHSIPVGTTKYSLRTEMVIHINGVPYILQLGPWAAGFCAEDPLEHGGLLNGIGTTQVKIIHDSDATFDIIAPTGSIGRLWDISNPYTPVDKGLFYTEFIIHLKKQ